MFTRLVLLSAVTVVAGSVFVARSVADEKTAAGTAAVGAAAPDFQLKDQDGKIVTLGEFKDKVVVLEWFNEACPFVVKHYKNGDMNQLATRYNAKGVVWLAVNSTNSTNSAHNKKVAGDWKIERPVLDDSAGTVGHRYAAKTTPQMFVVNKGTIVYAGAIDSIRSAEPGDISKSENHVAKALDEVLAGKPVSKPTTESYGCSVKYAK